MALEGEGSIVLVSPSYSDKKAIIKLANASSKILIWE